MTITGTGGAAIFGANANTNITTFQRVYVSEVEVLRAPLPVSTDLSIVAKDITIALDKPCPNPNTPGDLVTATITATINELAGGAAGAFNVDFYEDQPTSLTPSLIGTVPVAAGLAPNGTTSVSITRTYNISDAGLHKITVAVDLDGNLQPVFPGVTETIELNNNMAVRSFCVCGPCLDLITVECAKRCTNSLCTNPLPSDWSLKPIPWFASTIATYPMKCRAWYTMQGPLSPCKGSDPTVWIEDANGASMWQTDYLADSTLHTNIYGLFYPNAVTRDDTATPAGKLNPGVYFLGAKVSDTSFVGYWQQEFIIPAPQGTLDLATTKQSITLTDSITGDPTPQIGVPFTITATVYNLGSLTADPYKVDVWVDNIAAPIAVYSMGALAGGAPPIQVPFTTYTLWTEGEHCFTFKVNTPPAYSEQTFANNTATKCFIVKVPKPDLVPQLCLGDCDNPPPLAPVVGNTLTNQPVVRVHNRGTAPYDPAVVGTAVLQVFQDGASLDVFTLSDNIAIGSFKDYFIASWTPPNPNTNLITAIVDIVNSVDETSETNNTDSMSFPDLYCMGLRGPGRIGAPDASPIVNSPLTTAGASINIADHYSEKDMSVAPFVLHAELSGPGGVVVPFTPTINANYLPGGGLPIQGPGVYSLLSGYPYPVAGDWTLRVWFDRSSTTYIVNNTVPERENTTNNFCQTTFTVINPPAPAQCANLSPTDLFTSPPDARNAPVNGASAVNAVVYSSGNLSVNANFDVGLFEVYPSGQEIQVDIAPVAAPLNPGGNRTVTFPNYNPNTRTLPPTLLPPPPTEIGLKALKVVADINNTVQECPGTEGGTFSRYFKDLYMRGISVPYNGFVHDYSPARGIPTSLLAKIGVRYPSGDKPSSYPLFNLAAYTVRVRVTDTTGTLPDDVFHLNAGDSTRSLLLNGAYVFGINHTTMAVDPDAPYTNLPNGVKPFRVCVKLDDHATIAANQNRVPENNETNNERCETFNVHEPLPDLTPWKSH